MTRDTQTLAVVMAIPMLTWIGVFAYMLFIDRSLRRLEAQEREQDEL